jgi:hypothetical protein
MPEAASSKVLRKRVSLSRSERAVDGCPVARRSSRSSAAPVSPPFLSYS